MIAAAQSCGTDGHTWQSCSAHMHHMLSAKSTFQQKPCLVVRTVHTYVTINIIIIIITVHTWHAEDLILRNEWCIVLEQYLEQLLCIHVWLHLTLPKSLLHWNDVRTTIGEEGPTSQQWCSCQYHASRGGSRAASLATSRKPVYYSGQKLT